MKKLAAALPATVVASRQPNTVRVYAFGFQRWKRWTTHYVEVTPLPAVPRYIALYLIYLSQGAKTNSAIVTALNSISWAHKLSALQDP